MGGWMDGKAGLKIPPYEKTAFYKKENVKPVIGGYQTRGVQSGSQVGHAISTTRNNPYPLPLAQFKAGKDH